MTIFYLLWCLSEQPTKQTCIQAGSTYEIHQCIDWLERDNVSERGYWACNFDETVYFRLKPSK